MTALLFLNDGGFFVGLALIVLVAGGLLAFVARKYRTARKNAIVPQSSSPEEEPSPGNRAPQSEIEEKQEAKSSPHTSGGAPPAPPSQPAPEPGSQSIPGEGQSDGVRLDRFSVHDQELAEPEPVDFAVFSPDQLARGTTRLVDVWAMSNNDFEEVKKLAAEVGQSSLAGRKTSVPVAHDSRLVLEFSIPSLGVEKQLDEIRWIGEPANASFVVAVPDDAHLGGHLGEVGIFVNGARLARIRFALQVGEVESAAKENVAAEVMRVEKAFASYAAEDRSEVLGRIQGMKTVFPELDIFVDALSLQAGDDWNERLTEEIVNRDTLFLFWSSNASRSEYVEKEWRLALEQRGIDYIDPVPLQVPSVAPPPADLAALHFADAFATYAYLSNQ